MSKNNYENIKDLVQIILPYECPTLANKTLPVNEKALSFTMAEVIIHDIEINLLNHEDELSYLMQEDVRLLLRTLHMRFGKVSYFLLKEAIYTTDCVAKNLYACNFLMQFDIIFGRDK